MLTASCKRIVRASWNLDVVDGELGAPTGSSSFHFIGFPILHEGNLVAVPLVDPVVEAGAEVVVFAPLDGSTAQSLGIDLQILHRRAQFGGIRRPTGSLERRFNRHSPDPALRHGLCRKFRACLTRRSLDFLMDRLLFLKESIRVYHVELSVFQTGKFSLGLEMTPGYVIVLPAQLAQRFERAHLRDPRRPRVNPVWTGIF